MLSFCLLFLFFPFLCRTNKINMISTVRGKGKRDLTQIALVREINEKKK